MIAILFIAILLTSTIETASTLSNWLAVQRFKVDKVIGRFRKSAMSSAVADTKSEGTAVKQVLSDEQLRIFERDGVLVVRGLVHGDELKAIVHEVEKVGKQTGTFGNAYKNLAFNHYRTSKAIKDVAFFSDVPQAAAQLIHSQSKDKKTGPVRLLKDAVLCFAPGASGCGWHVDDKFFWPAEDETTGVNVWIALSPMTAKTGGGLAIAPGSHKEKIAQDAIPIIRAGGTCGMETLSPSTHKKLESMKMVYDMQPGDAILHDRWLFHRSDNFNEEVPAGTVLNRYSIRYMPEDTRSFNNNYDPVFKDEKYKGKEGRPLKEFGGYFPQVYPNAIASEDNL